MSEIVSGYVRKGLNTRIREALDAQADVEWGIDFDIEHGDALRYHVEQAGEVYFFTPGECADWLGLDR